MRYKAVWWGIICALIATVLFITPDTAQAAPAHNRLYVITMQGSGTDAMILESNGHFALIDAGEDPSYPDGRNPRYPFRTGITTNPEWAVDDRLFAVIKQLGIKKFDFIIGTHTHSDHIGNLPEVLDKYPADKVLLKRYSDERIIWKDDLWDNLYGYERVLESARRNNVNLIQDITAQDAHIVMGDMTIELMNYENEWMDAAHTKLKPINDDNVNSIISIISVNNKRIYLGGDLQNFHGHEDKYGPIIGKVDLMKSNHHNDTGSNTNTPAFLNNLHPSVLFKTTDAPFFESFIKQLDELGTKVVSAGRSDVPALVFDLSSEGITEISTDVFAARGFNQQGNTWYYTKWDGSKMSAGLHYHNDRLYYFEDDGSVATGWKTVGKHTYYFDEHRQGAAVQGWNTFDNRTYYHFNYFCQMQTGWIKPDSFWYYLMNNGALLTSSTTPDGWMVDAQGRCIGQWKKDQIGWWFSRADRSYPTNCWEQIDGLWYRFDTQGYMLTGWSLYKGAWYYLTSSGDMATNRWIEDNGWYYVNAEGVMQTGWLQLNQAWYYLNSSGLMQTGWVHSGSNWYYLNHDGSLLTNTTTPDGWIVDENGACVRSVGTWQRDASNQWYYAYQHGGYPAASWLLIDGVWYYFNQAGYAVTGWQNIAQTWYYFTDDCAMKTGWLQVGGQTYYLLPSGEMAVGTHTIDKKSYTFAPDGALIQQPTPHVDHQPADNHEAQPAHDQPSTHNNTPDDTGTDAPASERSGYVDTPAADAEDNTSKALRTHH